MKLYVIEATERTGKDAGYYQPVPGAVYLSPSFARSRLRSYVARNKFWRYRLTEYVRAEGGKRKVKR